MYLLYAPLIAVRHALYSGGGGGANMAASLKW
jgi:hypothetical protein